MGTLEKWSLSKVHERQQLLERMDLQKIMPDSYPFLYLGGGAGEGSSKKRKRILRPVESDSDSSSDSDDDPNNEEEIKETSRANSSYRIPKKGRRIWDSKQMENLEKISKTLSI